MRKNVVLVAVVAIATSVATYVYLRRTAHVLPEPKADAFWRHKLEEAQKETRWDPGSAMRHNDAAEAYDHLGDLQGFEREIRSASRLDPANPFHDYTAYLAYKRRGLKGPRDEALRHALELDPKNPLGHYELGWTYEERGDWSNALKEYQTVQNLLAQLRPEQQEKVSGERLYVGSKRGSYILEPIYQDLPDAINRASAKIQKR